MGVRSGHIVALAAITWTAVACTLAPLASPTDAAPSSTAPIASPPSNSPNSSPTPTSSPTSSPTLPAQPSPSPTGTTHNEPDTGAFHLVTDPASAPVEWRFTFRSDDGRVSREPMVVAAGETTSLGQNQLPGVFYFALNGTECSGDVEIVALVEVQLEIKVDDSGACTLTVTGQRDIP